MKRPKNHIHYATFTQRLLAHNIDLLPILGLFYFTYLLPNTFSSPIFLTFLYLAYHTLFELSPLRATPGKLCVKLKVNSLSPQSEPLKIIVRNSLKPLSLILLFFGYILINIQAKKQALHDYIAGTVVLFNKK